MISTIKVIEIMSEEDKIEDFACVEESPKRGEKSIIL